MNIGCGNAFSVHTRYVDRMPGYRRAWESMSKDYRLLERWQPPTYRIGEATNPGPTICSVNPGGWSRVEGLLAQGYDIVAVQETFL
eukprot:4393975-Amphidinium_carterae.1